MTTRRARARRRQVLVFTEGPATEPSYVDAIKHLQSAFAVRVDDRHGNPGLLVPLAISELGRLARENRDEGAPEGDQPVVWCVFDRDEHQNVDGLIEQASAAGVRVAFSHPCMELWLLLHFEWSGRPEDGSCGRVTRAVERHLASYARRGKRVSLDDLGGRYEAAREHAQRLREQHRRDEVTVPTRRDPSTNVWEFVDELGVSY